MKKLIFALLFFFIYFSVCSAGFKMTKKFEVGHDVAIVTSANDHDQVRLVDVLIKSIRTFGCDYSDCPIYIGISEGIDFSYESLKREGVRIVKVRGDTKVTGYLFAFKALVAAEVEKIVGDK